MEGLIFSTQLGSILDNVQHASIQIMKTLAIRLYSLPWEYWDEDFLKSIGSMIGDFIKVVEETKTVKPTTFFSYARICVYMDLKQPLPDTVRLFHEDHDWVTESDTISRVRE